MHGKTEYCYVYEGWLFFLLSKENPLHAVYYHTQFALLVKVALILSITINLLCFFFHIINNNVEV